MAVRILRLLEYVYPDLEAAEQDMARWTLKSPPNNPNRMRSVTLPIETFLPEAMDRIEVDPRAKHEEIQDGE